jgi:hypothetical protein
MPNLKAAAALAACLMMQLVLLGGAVTPAIAAQDEGELLGQIKRDVFDQKWDGVLASCSLFIAQYSHSEDLSRIYYYKAQALEHGKGKEDEAILAYTDYLTRFPNETGALHEDALLKRISLATTLYLKGNKNHIGIILQGMDGKGYPGIFAAIQASKLDHGPARAKALPILLRCANTETDPEVRNECLLGVLRIDPQKAGQVTQPKDAGGPPAAGNARLIRVEVFDKLKNQVSVRVNMPLSFVDILLDSLGDELQQEIGEEMKKKGIQLDKLLESIKKNGPQTIIEIDNDEQHIKVWVE